MRWLTRVLLSTVTAVVSLAVMKNMWENLGEPWERDSRSIEDTFSNFPSPNCQWPYNIYGQFQDPRQRREQYGKNHQRSHVHQSQQPNPEQEHWEVQPPTYMG